MPVLAPRTTPAAPSRARAPRAARVARALAAAALALVTGAGALLATGGPAAAEDVTWTVRTASNDFGSTRTGFSYAVDPGQQVDDALVVANRGAEPVELTVYAADGYTTDSGQFDLLTPDLDQVGVGAWARPSTGTVTVEAGSSVEIPFTVAVPANATPGDYAGGILTSLVQPDDSAGITVDRRLGIRVDLRVGGELAPALTVEDAHVDYTGTLNPAGTGDALVTYTLHNTGNTVLSAQQAVAVTGPFGWLRVEADADAVEAPPQLLPGERWTVEVPVSGVAPAVRLGADVQVVPVMTDASGSTSALPVVGAGAHTWAVPWTALALLVLVVAGAVAVPRVARRRRRQRADREDQRVRTAVEEALRGRGTGEALPAD